MKSNIHLPRRPASDIRSPIDAAVRLIAQNVRKNPLFIVCEYNVVFIAVWTEFRNRRHVVVYGRECAQIKNLAIL